jgi:RNA polymerase sigma-70 factor (ECF subfamily)
VQHRRPAETLSTPLGFRGVLICEIPVSEYACHAMQENTTDEQLMLNYRNGDAEAFEVLYQKHKGPLYRYVLRQCDESYVDEIFQDIWMKIINARERYKANAKFTTWLYNIAHNRIIDHYRRQNIRPVGNNEGNVEAMPTHENRQPDQQAQNSEHVELLLTAIRNLPSDQRDTFLLHEEAGLNIEEIAETTGVSFEAAKSRLRYAIKKLRDDMKALL